MVWTAVLEKYGLNSCTWKIWFEQLYLYLNLSLKDFTYAVTKPDISSLILASGSNTDILGLTGPGTGRIRSPELNVPDIARLRTRRDARTPASLTFISNSLNKYQKIWCIKKTIRKMHRGRISSKIFGSLHPPPLHPWNQGTKARKVII